MKTAALTTTNGSTAEAAPDDSKVSEIVVRRIGRETAKVRIEGTAPLIVNRFSEKAKQHMLDSQSGRATHKEPRNPEKSYLNSLYTMEDGRYGFPATAFKSAIASAARYFDKSVTITALKQAVFVKGEGTDMLVPIIGAPKMREDTVRNSGGGVCDLRWRGEFWPWSATLEVVYIRSALSIESLLALVDAAGIGGVGEWRPSSPKSTSGMYGTFNVAEDTEVGL